MEKKINEIDKRMCRLASYVFTKEHYGNAILETEYQYDKKLLETYKQEIDEAKKIIATDSDFQALPYQEKIAYTAELIMRLRIKNHCDEEVIVGISDEPKEKYVNSDDLFDSISQEPYDPIFKGKK